MFKHLVQLHIIALFIIPVYLGVQMDTLPLVSIVMPVYGAERWIHRAVDSVLAQTFTDFELILIDDESPDTCGQICDEYAKKDARIRVIHQKNSGCAGASNRGIKEARGHWLIFVDDDDEISPYLLQISLHQKVSASHVHRGKAPVPSHRFP